MENKCGLKTPPCLTPERTSNESLRELFHFTMLVKLEYQYIKTFIMQRGTFRWISFKKMPLWSTLSKPLVQSRKAAKTFYPRFVTSAQEKVAHYIFINLFWSAMFLSIFYHQETQQNQQQHCRSAFWKVLSFILSYILIGVPWWLGGYSTCFWIRRMGFDSSSQSTLYGLKLISIKIHEKKLSSIPLFLKSTWQ